MPGRGRTVKAQTLIVLSISAFLAVQDHPSGQPQLEQAPDAPAKVPSDSTREPTMMVFDTHEIRGILGKEVRSPADENMGRIVDVLVDRGGQVAAAIIDFGGFLGLGSRKVAVSWNALRFPTGGSQNDRILLELTRDQVRAAPEFKEDKPVVVLRASGNLESLPFQ